MSKYEDVCVICTQSIMAKAINPHWVRGQNAAPLAPGQCCDPCGEYVSSARLHLEALRSQAVKQASGTAL